jgi:hypothetical protein
MEIQPYVQNAEVKLKRRIGQETKGSAQRRVHKLLF